MTAIIQERSNSQIVLKTITGQILSPPRKTKRRVRGTESKKNNPAYEKATDYLKTSYLPTGYDETKLKYEVNRSYGKNANIFGMKRGDYKPYNEYKKSKTN